MSELVYRTCVLHVCVAAQDKKHLPETPDLATAMGLALPDAWTVPPPPDGFTIVSISGRGVMPDLKIDPMRRARARP